MKIAVCEDDERELARLAKMIGEYQANHGLGPNCRSFYNGTDFLHNIKGGEYDLVILDVLMPGISGIQVAQELRRLDKNVRLIFISSSSEFAVESYSVGAYYYLLKPADAGSLFPLLDKVRNELSVQDKQELVLKSRESVIAISFAQLEYIEVINKTVSFHLSDGVVHELASALSAFEKKLLDRPEFFKPHRSYIINLNYVKTIATNSVVMKSGNNIPVSRLLRSLLQDAYMHFVFSSKADACIPDTQAPAAPEQSMCLDGAWRILLVDDDPVDRTFWAGVLQHHGCIVQMAGNAAEALRMASGETYDCILLDVMIPGENGFTVCEKIRRIKSTPVIFLSCLTESDKQLDGFSVGGIDYITKNTPADLFWAKVETRLRLASSGRTQLCYGPLLLDLTQRKVMINQKELLLTPIEFDILQRLAEHPEHIFTPEEIFDMIWPGQPWDGGQTVHTHISRLRRKLENAWEKHFFIEAVWGQGYHFVLANDYAH